jgi:cis-3-alkyl-4-acyloxetan-2-one decarboxylase
MVTAPQAPRRLPERVARLYPFTPRAFLTAGGARLSYLDEGPRGDEAVLLLHGNPTWSFYYRDLVRELAPTLRCIVPDHVGMGLSDQPGDYDYRLASRIDDLEALVASLGLRRVHLVVHDWGGAIGFGWAARRPGLVGRIVILNTAAFPSDHVAARILLCRVPVLGACLVRGLNAFAAGAAVMAMHARRLTPDERAGYLWPYDSWAHRVAVHRFVRDIPLEPTHPSRATLEAIAARLPDLAANVGLILWGGRDFCFDDYFLSRWRALYPQAECVRYPDAGHYVLEDAGPDIRRRICEFFQNPLNPPTIPPP